MAVVLNLSQVNFIRDDRVIVAPITWQIGDAERWLVLGPNGGGKTTLLRIAAMYEHPTSGTVDVLGERFGRTDVRRLRQRVGFVSPALTAQLRADLRCLDVVRTAKYAALEPWWHRYSDADDQRALACLARMNVEHLAQRSLATLSSGEQQRVVLARALMNEPGIILLDEPSARLDLGGREQLIAALSELTLDPSSPPLVLVTHHLDEAPPGLTHVLMMRDGRAVAQGPIERCLTAEALSECFGVSLQLERRPDGRLSAWHSPTPSAGPGRS